jgi:hypothetical protein
MAMAPSAAGGMMPPDPTGGAGAGGDPTAGAGDGSGGDQVVVSITMTADGSYMVYAGDEPDDSGDMSGDDADAMGAAGAAPAGGGGMGGSSGGQPADSIGAALKIAMDIMNSAASSAGAPGSADDQMSAGYSSSKAPTPATGMKQKY